MCCCIHLRCRRFWLLIAGMRPVMQGEGQAASAERAVCNTLGAFQRLLWATVDLRGRAVVGLGRCLLGRSTLCWGHSNWHGLCHPLDRRLLLTTGIFAFI